MDPKPATRARPRLATALVLCLLLAAAVRLTSSDQLAVALVGVLAAPLATIVASQVVGPQAALWAGMLVALSPIHTLASRAPGPESILVSSLLVGLWLLAALEGERRLLLAIFLGLVVGGLLGCGVAAFAAVAILLLSWMALGRARTAALVATGVALAEATAAGWLGLARSSLDYGEIPAWIPETTLEGVVRCAGASFTRVIGLEYQLLVSHARYLLPLTALLVALMLRGAVRLPARPRGLLLAGAFVPFALGAAMALVTGRVTPLQANRLLAALPFVALLMASGLASLSGTRAWAAGTAVAGTLAAFLALALAR
jgi:hypothetical protein